MSKNKDKTLTKANKIKELTIADIWKQVLPYLSHQRDFWSIATLNKQIYNSIISDTNPVYCKNIIFRLYNLNGLKIEKKFQRKKFVYGLILDNKINKFVNEYYINCFTKVKDIGFTCQNCHREYIGIDGFISNTMIVVSCMLKWIKKKNWKNASKCNHCFNAAFDVQKCFKCKTIYNIRKIARCSKCKHVYYCSEKCQKEDFKEHKKNCVRPLQRLLFFEQTYRVHELKDTKFIPGKRLKDIFMYLILGYKRAQRTDKDMRRRNIQGRFDTAMEKKKEKLLKCKNEEKKKKKQEKEEEQEQEDFKSI